VSDGGIGGILVSGSDGSDCGTSFVNNWNDLHAYVGNMSNSQTGHVDIASACVRSPYSSFISVSFDYFHSRSQVKGKY
jgi:hypothetical protein